MRGMGTLIADGHIARMELDPLFIRDPILFGQSSWLRFISHADRLPSSVLKEASMNLQKFFTLVGKKREPEAGSKEVFFVVDRREHPRHVLELPLDYTLLDGKERSGIVADASEGGLLVYLDERIEKGSLLRIDLFFAKNSELNTIRAMVKVVWSDSSGKKLEGEYKHGLAFQAFHKEDLDTLKVLLQQNEATNRA